MWLIVVNRGLRFWDSVCNLCHDLTMLYFRISDIGIIYVKGFGYGCIIHDIIKSEAIHLLGNYVLEDRGYV